MTYERKGAGGGSGSGGGEGVTDHGALDGLGDDDHTQYLKEAGGTMTGALALAGNAAGALQAVPLQQAQQLVADLDVAIALKAPLASPALTGTPTAPTPAAADNDTSIATTAYVQTELGSFVRTAQSVNAQTGTTYTPVAGDAGKLVTLSNAAAITFTVPQDSAVTIAIGTYIDLMALGAGQVTVVAGTGATLRVSGLTAKSRAQYARFGVQKVAANTWVVFGDLAAS